MSNATLRLIEAAEAELTQETYEALRAVHAEAQTYDVDELDDGEGNVGIDVRLNVQVSEDGESYVWVLNTGDASYDQDHRGLWGSGFVGREADEVSLIAAARDLVDQVLEDAAQQAA